MTRVKTGDAREALGQIIREKAAEAAGSNDLVSKAEQKALDPFLGRAADAVRAAGGKGAKVTIDALEAQATSEAQKAWDAANPPTSAGAAFLSQKEVQAVAKQDPALGALSKLAYLRVSQSAAGGDAKQAVQAFFSTFAFAADEETGVHALHAGLPGATMIDARPIFPANRAALPPAVLATYDVYARAMEHDWATTSLQRAKISGHDVYVVYTTTDGDRSYLDIVDKKGAPIASGRINGDVFLGWDEAYGRTRFEPEIVALDQPTTEEGFSEPDEIAAAGQVPHDWAGELQLTQGQLHYDQFHILTDLDLPGAVGKPQLEVAAAAFEYLWERSLKHRTVGGNDPFLLGSHREGTLVVGSFTRNDGKTYEVADWRDIDDGSFTLYFDRTAEGRLKLATEQYNN